MAEYTLQQSPRLRTSKNVFNGGLQGLWTPTVTFSTPGDLSVVYTAQSGFYCRIGSLIICFFDIDCTPTFGTSANNLLITNLPFTSSPWGSATGVLSDGNVSISRINTAEDYTCYRASVETETNAFHIKMSKDNVLGRPVDAADVTSAQALIMSGGISYIAKEES